MGINLAVKCLNFRAKYTRPVGENIGRILEILNRKLEEYWKS